MTESTCSSSDRSGRVHGWHRSATAGAIVLFSAGIVLPTVTAAGASAATPTTGWIRFAHFATGRQPVAVTIDGATLTPDATFEDVTPYRMVAAGVHTVVVTTVGAKTPAIVGKATVIAGGAVTVSAVDTTPGLRLQTFTDDLSAAGAGQAKIRVIQTVASVPAVTVSLTPSTPTNAVRTEAAAIGAPAAATPLSATTIAVPAVAFGAASPYLAVAAGTYQVLVKSSTGKTLIKGTNWPVSAGTVASIVVIDATKGPTLEVIRDAVGATSTPLGGLATGFGGAADLLNPPHHQSSAVEAAGLGLGAAGAAAAVGAVSVRRRRRLAPR